VVVLRWDDIDLTTGRLHVRRAKGGDASVHPISARESRALRKLLRESPTSPYVFMSERRAPLSAAGYQRMVARAGVAAKFSFLVHSHMLRHACGFKLANDGHDTRDIQAYLGHRSIMSTVRYTALTPNRFKNFQMAIPGSNWRSLRRCPTTSTPRSFRSSAVTLSLICLFGSYARKIAPRTKRTSSRIAFGSLPASARTSARKDSMRWSIGLYAACGPSHAFSARLALCSHPHH
jgi:Phage integrase family